MEEQSVFQSESENHFVGRSSTSRNSSDRAVASTKKKSTRPPEAQTVPPAPPAVTAAVDTPDKTAVVPTVAAQSEPAALPRSTPLVPSAEQRMKSQLRAEPTGRSDSDSSSSSSSSHSHSRHYAMLPQQRPDNLVDALSNEEEEDEQQFVDEFGFIIEDEKDRALDQKYVRGVSGKKVQRREIKWAHMARDWSRTNVKMYAKLKERCRKGIPTRFRSVAWQLLIGSHVQMQDPNNKGVYIAFRDKVLKDKEVDAVISRDLSRTFTNHVLFQEDNGIGQTFLRNVLHAYAGTDPEVGYTQGMAFVVGSLSTQMGEEESFWALHEMMNGARYKMREVFKPGFPLLQQFFYQLKRLIARLLPKLHKRFEEFSVEPSFYASQWFLTLFASHFPFRALLRIWDVFFCEGWKIIFRTGIALLKWESKRLLAMPYDEMLPALKHMQDGKDPRELLHRAHRIKFKTAELNQYGDEYWEAMKQRVHA
ncbi:rab-like GTPase activating protein [Strigomonas culicis]|uniref:Rab-like GTPase activating protein n=1 Tax=Strigomonas culicis TaxID=28005 RepID=S9WMJ4_9TRYP|nr:rab-like GTPase activating protein [Strigomonas culicis]|eukprot:EPY37155.1 rab-like GTPase activating protein [Strigomonas culicis]